MSGILSFIVFEQKSIGKYKLSPALRLVRLSVKLGFTSPLYSLKETTASSILRSFEVLHLS